MTGPLDTAKPSSAMQDAIPQTPEAAPLKALHPGPRPWPGGLTSAEFAAAILAALPSGWVLAREQDAADGEALRRLREALPKAEYPDGWVIELEDDPEESVRRRLVCVTVTDAENAEQAFGSGATIAEAADAARGVLEARDA